MAMAEYFFVSVSDSYVGLRELKLVVSYTFIDVF